MLLFVIADHYRRNRRRGLLESVATAIVNTLSPFTIKERRQIARLVISKLRTIAVMFFLLGLPVGISIGMFLEACVLW